MNNISPILISDSDSEDERKVQLGPDEISRFIPAALTNSQATEHESLNCSQGSSHMNTPTTSKNQMTVKIVDINDIMKGSSPIGLRDTIKNQSIASTTSSVIFLRNAKGGFFVRIPNLVSVSGTQKPNFINGNLNKNTVRKNKTPTHTKESKKSAVEPKIPYRCLDLKKRNFKIDCEGFTHFDRRGFFKAEQKRARRCSNILQYHIKVRQKILTDLIEQHENFKLHYKDLTTVDNPPNKVTSKTSMKPMKLLLSTNKLSEMEAQWKKKIDKPKLRRVRKTMTPARPRVKQPLQEKVSPNNSKRQPKLPSPKLKLVPLSKLTAPLDHVSPKNSKIRPKLPSPKLKLVPLSKLTASLDHVSPKNSKIRPKLPSPKLKLVPLSKLTAPRDHVSPTNSKRRPKLQSPKLKLVPLSKLTAPLDHVSPKNSQRRPKLKLVPLSKLTAPLDHDKFQESPQLHDSNKKTATFIDANNFEAIEQLDFNNQNQELYFINEHKVVTALYMDTFPAFKSAVQLQKVKIVDKPSPASENVMRDDKHAAFCDFMDKVYVSPESSEVESNIYSEHSYSTKIYS